MVSIEYSPLGNPSIMKYASRGFFLYGNLGGSSIEGVTTGSSHMGSGNLQSGRAGNGSLIRGTVSSGVIRRGKANPGSLG